MPGLRRLRDVGSKISGALTGALAEGEQPAADPSPGRAAAPSSTARGSAQEGSASSSSVEPAEAVPRSDASATAQAPAVTESDAPGTPEPSAAAASTASPVQEDAVPTAPETALEPDAVCAAAVDLAREVALEVGGDFVGEHLGADAEGDLVVTHSFATTQPGYVGWRWAVTVARAEGSDVVTVDEVVLLPGSGALLAPAWVPWSERLQPGDLGPGDLLPPPDDDPRLVPSYADVDADPLPFDLHRELGLGRPRVLSADGRADAAERWFDGEQGPDSPIARQAPGRCGDCGFLAPMAGSLGLVFGVCANGYAPDDGRVVALLHGCGAHSETTTTAAHANTTPLAVEHEELELVDVAALPDEPAAAAED